MKVGLVKDGMFGTHKSFTPWMLLLGAGVAFSIYIFIYMRSLSSLDLFGFNFTATHRSLFGLLLVLASLTVFLHIRNQFNLFVDVVNSTEPIWTEISLFWSGGRGGVPVLYLRKNDRFGFGKRVSPVGSLSKEKFVNICEGSHRCLCFKKDNEVIAFYIEDILFWAI